MRYFLASLKAAAAGLGVFIGSGVLQGHWLADAHIAEALIGATVTWLVPNVGTLRRRGTANVDHTGTAPT